MIIETKAFKTSDGKLFDTKEDAILYENTIQLENNISKWVHDILNPNDYDYDYGYLSLNRIIKAIYQNHESLIDSLTIGYQPGK